MSKPSHSNEIQIIEQFNSIQTGDTILGNHKSRVEIEKKDNKITFRVFARIDSKINESSFLFTTGGNQYTINGIINGSSFSLNTQEKNYSEYYYGVVNSINNLKWDKSIDSKYRSYFYTEKKDILYNNFGTKDFLSLTIKGVPISIGRTGSYLYIECHTNIAISLFNKITYTILLAVGFISGKFIQDQSYTFQYHNGENHGFEYQVLRPSFSSIYHALTWNPYSYRHCIGDDIAEKLYNENTLKHFDENSLIRLTELILNNSQIQYAIVLFNEANGNNLSLLIKNNCFYVVLEVLKKFFFDIYKEKLPNDYTKKANVEKYKHIFGNIINLTNREIHTLEKRNAFLHGDIKSISDLQMLEIMQVQITLVYRLLLTHAGFEGYIIDHFAIRNNDPNNSFIKLN